MALSSYAILDNGGYEIKYDWIPSSRDEEISSYIPKRMPNCIAKVQKSMQSFVGDEISSIQNTSQLIFHRPIDRGYLVNWNLEKEILQRVFDSNHLNISSYKSTNLLFTLPPYCPQEIQIDTYEMLFDEFSFHSILCRPAPWFSAYEYSYTPSPTTSQSNTRNSIVIDSGFSFTHILPFIDGNLVKHAAKRINVGGKLLTNYLKETISYRQWNVMDEFLLINQVKEDVCFVSTAFESELTKCYQMKGQMIVPISYAHRIPSVDQNPTTTTTSQAAESMEIQDHQSNGIDQGCQPHGDDEDEDEEEEEEDVEYLRKFFVMPDFHRIMKGYVKQEGEAFAPDEQVLTMESERFSIPEVLFRPTDIGMNQAGIVETIGQVVNSLHELEVGLCKKNIILTGGNALFPNYERRIESEICQYIPDQWAKDVKIFRPDDPINYAWRGAARFVRDQYEAGTITKHFVTKQEYQEQGERICFQKFSY